MNDTILKDRQIDIFVDWHETIEGCGTRALRSLNIVFGVNASYIPPMGIMIHSLLANNPQLDFHFHLFMESYNDEDLDKIKGMVKARELPLDIYFLNQSKLDETFGNNYAFYLRLIACKILLDKVEKFLYIDADTLCVGNIEKILDVDFEGCPLMAVSDTMKGANLEQHRKDIGLPSGAPYFNSGVLYIDVAKWRELDLQNKLMQLADEVRKGKRKVWFPDQDILNIAATGYWTELPYIYNLQIPILRENLKGVLPEDAVILHYTGGYKAWRLWENEEFFDEVMENCKEIALYRQYTQTSLWPDFRDGKISGHDFRILGRDMLKQRKFMLALKFQLKYYVMKIKEIFG